jgi:DNA replication protein DnaC
MVTNTTLDRLRGFRMAGFVEELIQQMSSPTYADLSFDDRLTLLVDSEHVRRLDTRTKRMMYNARLPNTASIEEIDFLVNRGLNKKQIVELAQGNWLRTGTNIIVTGATGTGKTYIGSAIANSLIRQEVAVRYKKTNIWLADLQANDESRRLPQAIASYKKLPLLVFDEWLLDPVSATDARRLLDIFDSRHHKLSCMFLTQLPVAAWHARIQDPTLADAIMDRLAHNSVRIEISGESMRKIKAPDLSQYQEENT